MATDNIAPFIGTWHVKWVGGDEPFVDENCQMLIGTGTRGDRAPFLTAEFVVCAGFTLLAADGSIILSSGDGDGTPPLMLVHGTLRSGGLYQGRPLRLYVSVAEASLVDGGKTYALYATTYLGDPDQVGVWGADGNPPPNPGS